MFDSKENVVRFKGKGRFYTRCGNMNQVAQVPPGQVPSQNVDTCVKTVV